ncbi:separase isoform X2, partial [Tanacetum coccineum]
MIPDRPSNNELRFFWNRKRMRVDAKCSACNLVKRLLATIEKRLKRRPEVDLFETHAEYVEREGFAVLNVIHKSVRKRKMVETFGREIFSFFFSKKDMFFCDLDMVVKVLECIASRCIAARMYYHLAERLTAKGLVIEALTYADKGYSLRDALLSQSFTLLKKNERKSLNIEWHRGKQEVDVQDRDSSGNDWWYQLDYLIPNPISHMLVLRKVLAPHSLDVLETSVSEFFETLPEFTVLCMSLLSEKSDKFLKNLLSESPTSAWIMISRISRNSGPLLVILPICKTFEDFKFETEASLVGDDWTCPWVHGVFDKLAPILRKVLEEDGKLTAARLNANERRDYRSKLDKHFLDLLRGLENSWFGPWKYLLLGEWSDNNDLDETV